VVELLANQFQDHWFVVARSSEVNGSAPLSVTVCGKPFALVRDPRSGVIAFEDRCPHRGVPLSLGKLGSEGLVCRYHGWTFGADGHCRRAPGCDIADKLDVRVAAYPTKERDGLIWISGKNSNPMPLRAMELVPSQRRFITRMSWRAPILDAQENFLDALHTPFIHSGIVRDGTQRVEVKVVLQKSPDGFSVEYFGQPRQSGLLFRLFESPRIVERAHFSGLSMAQIEYHYKSGWKMWISLYFTPETATSTHVFATLHVAGRWAPAWIVHTLVWPLLKRVGLQDQYVLEEQERTRVRFPERRYVVTDSDVARPYLEAAWNDRESEMPQRREILLKL
jgi:phenylpropionate dioxygenase-like ring-hydroxylating dioxygenase large terminal subunit